jgi:hypothetical protein
VIDFDCPRCSSPSSEDFYGPCTACRDGLRTSMARESVDVEAAAYEPKMNVVPNAVATKD